jgi:hypothetical protein
MATIEAILGSSGDGKTTSTIINPDGKFDLENYQGMNPKSHFIINLDRKTLPFPGGMWDGEHRNYVEPQTFEDIRKALAYCAKNPEIKSVAIDTVNIWLAMKEFNDRKKMSFDQWKDVANDVIELNMLCNTTLRKDQIVYIFGHTMLETQQDGTEKMVFSVIGKKLKKTQPEGFYPIVLMTRVDYGDDGNNKYFFQTKANHSSAKTPLGLFTEFEIPNSLKLVDSKIREYYKIDVQPQTSVAA